MRFKKKKEYVSKADLTEFFLFYCYDYLIIKRYVFFTLFSFVILTLRMVFQFRIEFLIIEMVLIFIVIVFRLTIIRRKAIKIKELDFENIDHLINFFETPGERRKNNFKNLVEKLEIAHNHHYKMYSYEYFLKIILITCFVFFGFVIVYDFIAYYFLNFVLTLRVQFANFFISAFITTTVLTLFFQLREIEYRNVDKIKEWFKYYIDAKLSKITIDINEFIQTPNDKILDKNQELKSNLNNWYNFYCSRFSSSNELNDLFNSYKDLIFDSDEELFYLESFSNLKTRIKDYIQYLMINNNGNNTKSKSQMDLIEILNNYIEILNFNISAKRERINRKREKRKNQQIILSLVLAPSSLVISIISILLNFIV